MAGTGQKIEFEEATEFSKATALLENASEAIYSLESGDVRTVRKRSNLHAFTVALALSVHSIFEGLALGLEEQTSQVRNGIIAYIKTKANLSQFESLQIVVGIPLLLLSVYVTYSFES